MKFEIQITIGSSLNSASLKMIASSNLEYRKNEYAITVKLAVARIFWIIITFSLVK
ncbi:MAG: hypothetical protein ACFFFT_09535 [Candidatus Thorarchaeota archaeon]